ncbi:MAG: hypothetical protein ACE149_13530 [Armatimonadota bacterium]
MAGGRDLSRRSPRWLNGVIWSSGIGAAAYFIWRMLYCEGEPTCLPLGFPLLMTRLLALLTLPALLAATLLARAVRWVLE